LNTIGSVNITVNFGEEKRQVRFQVVSNNFPIPHDGILGKKFLEDNKIAIVYAKNEITSTLTEDNFTIVNQDSPHVDNLNIAVVPPRSEMIISVKITDSQIKENIYSQVSQNRVQCGNVVATVKNRPVLTKFVNQTENSIDLQPVDLVSLLYEKFEEAKIQVCTKFTGGPDNENRVQLLEKSLRPQHLNKEEYQSLKNIFIELSDVFLLEGDRLDGTSAIQHRIRTAPDIQPIHIKPYRLPQNHKKEISTQVDQMEKDGIIKKITSPWNAPLIVIPKKVDCSGKQKFRICVDFRKLK